MHPVNFEGGHEIKKPAWKPSYEDLQALNRGQEIYVKTISDGLPPMALFTLDEKGIINI